MSNIVHPYHTIPDDIAAAMATDSLTPEQESRMEAIRHANDLLKRESVHERMRAMEIPRVKRLAGRRLKPTND